MAVNEYVPADYAFLRCTSVDFSGRAKIPKTVNLNRNDTGLVIIAINLLLNNSSHSYANTNDIKLLWRKPNGQELEVLPLGKNSQGNVVYFGVSADMSSCAGEVNAILELLHNGNIAGSSSFPVYINNIYGM